MNACIHTHRSKEKTASSTSKPANTQNIYILRSKSLKLKFTFLNICNLRARFPISGVGRSSAHPLSEFWHLKIISHKCKKSESVRLVCSVCFLFCAGALFRYVHGPIGLLPRIMHCAVENSDCKFNGSIHQNPNETASTSSKQSQLQIHLNYINKIQIHLHTQLF